MTRQRILFTGVGGQGTLLASRLLGEAAMAEEMNVCVSEVHGMAQRGGVVESTVMLGGITGPIISDGEADIMVSFEPLETVRALAKCSEKSIIITNTVSIEPFTVKLGQAEYPDTAEWIRFMKDNYAMVKAIDADALAREAGTARAVNVVLLGTMSATGAVPVSADRIRDTITRTVKKKFVDANLKAFDLGFDAD